MRPIRYRAKLNRVYHRLVSTVHASAFPLLRVRFQLTFHNCFSSPITTFIMGNKHGGDWYSKVEFIRKLLRERLWNMKIPVSATSLCLWFFFFFIERLHTFVEKDANESFRRALYVLILQRCLEILKVSLVYSKFKTVQQCRLKQHGCILFFEIFDRWIYCLV